MSLLLDALKRAEKAKQDPEGTDVALQAAHVFSLDGRKERRRSVSGGQDGPDARRIATASTTLGAGDEHVPWPGSDQGATPATAPGAVGSSAWHGVLPDISTMHSGPRQPSAAFPGRPRRGHPSTRMRLILAAGLMLLTALGGYYAWAFYAAVTGPLIFRPDTFSSPSSSIPLVSGAEAHPSGHDTPVAEVPRMFLAALERAEPVSDGLVGEAPRSIDAVPKAPAAAIEPDPGQGTVTPEPSLIATEDGMPLQHKVAGVTQAETGTRVVSSQRLTPAGAVVRDTGAGAGEGRSSISISRGDGRNTTLSRLRRAYDAFQAGDYARAEQLYRVVATRQPRNRDALLGLAAVSTATRRIDEAYRIYVELLRRDPTDRVAMAALVSVEGTVDPAAAESRLKMLFQDGVDAPYLYFALGTLYVQQSRWADAQGAFFDAYRGDSANGDYAYNLAVSLDHLGKGREAARYYRRALALANNSVVAFDRGSARDRIRLLEQHLVGPESP